MALKQLLLSVQRGEGCRVEGGRGRALQSREDLHRGALGGGGLQQLGQVIGPLVSGGCVSDLRWGRGTPLSHRLPTADRHACHYSTQESARGEGEGGREGGRGREGGGGGGREGEGEGEGRGRGRGREGGGGGGREGEGEGEGGGGERTHCKDPVPGLEDGLVLVGRVVLSHQVDTLVLEGVGNWGGDKLRSGRLHRSEVRACMHCMRHLC